MHQAFNHLAQRVDEVEASLLQVIREVEAQNERETQLLEKVAYGKQFDEQVTPIQERVLADMQTVLERLDHAQDALAMARRTLSEISEI